jgi:hypothetical protein
MKYAQLLSISLKHTYYQDGWCPDFTVSPQLYSQAMLKADTQKLLPGKDTATLLRNHRCQVKPKTNGLDIYVPIDDSSKPIIKFENDAQLSFDLRLKNSEFPLYTDLSKLPNHDNFLVSTAKQDGMFGDNVFATFKIQRDFNNINAFSPAIEFSFIAKSVRWIYYLITNPDANDSDFSVAFNTSGPSDYTWQQRAISADDSIANMLTKEYPGMRKICFVSDQNIPISERGLKGIQLSQTQNKLFDNLPEPPLINYYQTNIDNTTQQAEAIYMIVKSIINTTLTKV